MRMALIRDGRGEDLPGLIELYKALYAGLKEQGLAFDLEPGEYVLEMKYVPEGARAGMIVSAVSILVFAVLLAVRKKRESRAVKVREMVQETQETHA